MAHVFVYGTLKRGQPNHDVLLDEANGRATFQGQGRTVEPYPLVIAGQHNVPRLLDLPGQGHCVEGEVYTVDERMLRFLDDFEGCPAAYQRTQVRVRVAVLGREAAPSAPPGPPSAPRGPPSAPPGPPSTPPGPPSAPPGPPSAPRGPPSAPPGPPSAPPGPPAADGTDGTDGTGTRTLRCFVYSAATYPPEWLQLPRHPSYDSLGQHGLRYHPRENR